MKKTSTNSSTFYKKCLVTILAIVSLSFSQSLFAHQVNYYTAACNSGPVYSVDANVSNVNSSSNYAWQYKNASNVWVCIVNGNNTINGHVYSVSGATSTATTNPAPIVFNNPTLGLQGLVIRCVISDGNGVNPCNMPNGNTWNSNSSSVNHTISVSNTPCSALGSIGDHVWYDTDRDGIQDASENGISGVTVKLRNASNTVIATTTTNSSGNYLFSSLAAGTYSVEFPVTVYGYILSPAYVGTNRNVDSDPSVTTGITPSITLTTGQAIINIDAGYAPDCSCTNSTANLLTNASFENGTTGWSWSSGNGSLTTGTGYVACGSKNGFNNQSSGTSKVWQDVTVAAGVTVNFSAYAGTHTAGIACSPKLSLIFLNASNAVISQTDVTVTRDVDVNNSQLQQYSITAVAPAGTVKARVQSSITCNTMKLDAFCLTVSANCVGGGTWNLNLPNGTLGASQAYTVNGVTIMAYGFNNGTPGTPTALYGKNAGADETGLGINSNSDFEIDVNHFVQLDLNQVIAAGVTSGTMSIGSMQAGEPAGVYGSNTLGVRGTLVMTVPVTLNSTPFPIPGFPTYRYISVQAAAPTPANVLLQQVSFSCPTNNGKIGDFVWEDINRNGIQDAGEPGIGGVTVTLGGAATATTTTAANGSYHFNNLGAGTYSVTFATPTAPGNTFVSTTSNVGANDAIDSDPVGGVVSNIVLAAGEVKNTVDAGFYRLINISGNVWNDANGLTDLQINHTGTQSLPNSLVLYLVDINTNQIVQAESVNPDGTYAFLDVNINTSYKIILTNSVAFPGQPSPSPFLPSGWQRVGENLGAGPLSGSDGVPNGQLFIDTETSDIINANFGIRVSSGEVIVG